MTIVDQTQLTPSCFGYDKAALSAPSLVGELSVTLRDLPHTLFGGLASNAAPNCGNVVTTIAPLGFVANHDVVVQAFDRDEILDCEEVVDGVLCTKQTDLCLVHKASYSWYGRTARAALRLHLGFLQLRLTPSIQTRWCFALY